MKRSDLILIILAILFLASILYLGRYSIYHVPGISHLYKLDRWTGKVTQIIKQNEFEVKKHSYDPSKPIVKEEYKPAPPRSDPLDK